MVDARTMGATALLAGAITAVSDPTGEGIGAGDFETLEHGVAATIHAPSGDRYRISVEWLGDRESEVQE
jgi:hypothetical protein